ncbi:hypothetical protein HXX76_010736 [Chlamydomonas incerta]|uniref:RING-type domain-containing protein n=1 Tax=Chlamydomonas incerta TaxID=51695 RepID=A0A835SZY1_CHLIN|nr:hypothetical protein HXX76_010736 [Chlamydomonas incerta]|eukprot:KAG2429500.1 hypothetical protein HXX76_010736 [Chlamydomonas incerta]
MEEIEEQLGKWQGDSIVCEAFFAPGKLQRRGIETLAQEYDFDVCYIWCAASRAECLRRVIADYNAGRDSWERYQARVSFIQEIPEKYFWERDDECEPYLLDRTCAHCRDRPYEPPGCQHCDDPTNAPMCYKCARQWGESYSCPTCRRQQRRRR